MVSKSVWPPTNCHDPTCLVSKELWPTNSYGPTRLLSKWFIATNTYGPTCLASDLAHPTHRNAMPHTSKHACPNAFMGLSETHAYRSRIIAQLHAVKLPVLADLPELFRACSAREVLLVHKQKRLVLGSVGLRHGSMLREFQTFLLLSRMPTPLGRVVASRAFQSAALQQIWRQLAEWGHPCQCLRDWHVGAPAPGRQHDFQHDCKTGIGSILEVLSQLKQTQANLRTRVPMQVGIENSQFAMLVDELSGPLDGLLVVIVGACGTLPMLRTNVQAWRRLAQT